MKEILTDLKRSKKTPQDLSLVRSIVLVSEFYVPSLRIENIMEIYFFRVDILGSYLQYPMAEVSSDRSIEAPRLWVNGSLSDIVSMTDTGLLTPKQEQEIIEQLRARNSSVLDYHPEIAHAKIIREQFFARVRRLEKAVSRIYGVKISKILGTNIEKYRKEIETAPEVKRYRYLEHTPEYMRELTREFLKRNNMPQLTDQCA